MSPYAAGEGSSSPRLALNSPIRVSAWQSGDWGPCPCQRVPGNGGSQHQPGLCLVPQPLCSLTAHVLRGMHPAEMPQGFVPPGRKETRPAILACGQGSSEENWRLPLECPRDLSLLGPYFLGIPGCAVEDPLHAAQLPSWLCLAGDNSPKGPACGCFGFSPGLSVTVMLQGRLEILVLLWHEKQGPRGQSEGKLVFHMSAPLRVVAVFIPQAEMQEQDRE